MMMMMVVVAAEVMYVTHAVSDTIYMLMSSCPFQFTEE